MESDSGMLPERIRRAVHDAVDAVNELLPESNPLGKAPATPIDGRGVMDSMAMVNFVAALEERLEEDFQLRIRLIDELAAQGRPSPMQTIETLCRYLEELLESKQGSEAAWP